ncbi:unnamed protein product [Mytilus edulis]|uniref:Transmembrane protein n=1 Tax=Mytilus edulis TaxID=6550 RepID=A0A8S3QG14_MYTED|nr:unnamed protein product [Mytilus edulis]
MESNSIVNNKSNQLNKEDVSILLEDDEILSCNAQASASFVSETTALLSSEDSNLHSQLSFTGPNPTLSSDSEIHLHCSQFPLKNRACLKSSVNKRSDETFLKLNINEDFLDLPDDEELPTLLKSHRYIDARKADDIPAKIFDVYSNPAVNKLENIEQTVDESGQNGATNWYLRADRHSHLCDKVYTYQFTELTEANVEKITAYNPNCEEQVSDVITYVNNSTFMKYYRILNGQKCSCSACCLVWVVATVISLTLGSCIIVIRRNTEGSTGLILMAVGAIVSSIAACCAWCIVFSKVQSKLLDRLQTGIWKINEKYHETTKCLIEFVTYIDYPCVSFCIHIENNFS